MKTVVIATVAALGLLPAPRKTERLPEPLVIAKGEYPFRDFVSRFETYLSHTYMIDEMQTPMIKAENAKVDRSMWFSIPRTLKLGRQASDEILGQLLLAKGWVVVPIDESRHIYKLIWLMGPKGQDVKAGVLLRTPAQILAQPKLVRYVSTTVKLEHANAQLVASNLRTFFNDPRGLSNLIPLGSPSQQTLMISGFQPSVARMLKLIEKADVPPREPSQLEQRLTRIEERLGKIEAAAKK